MLLWRSAEALPKIATQAHRTSRKTTQGTTRATTVTGVIEKGLLRSRVGEHELFDGLRIERLHAQNRGRVHELLLDVAENPNLHKRQHRQSESQQHT